MKKAEEGQDLDSSWSPGRLTVLVLRLSSGYYRGNFQVELKTDSDKPLIEVRLFICDGWTYHSKHSMQGYTQYFISSMWVIKCFIPFFSVLYLTFPVQMKRCLQMKYLQRIALGKHNTASDALMGTRLLSGSPQPSDRSRFPREGSQEASTQALYNRRNYVFIWAPGFIFIKYI